MLITKKVLEENLGLKNILVLDSPAFIINGGVTIARSLKYASLEEVKLANWFRNLEDGLLIIYEGNDFKDEEGWVIRLFDFSGWERWQEGEISPLNLYRQRKFQNA